MYIKELHIRLLKQTSTGLETLLTRKIAGICNNCYADFKTAGGSLEESEMKTGMVKTLCHYCAIKLIGEIEPQPNMFELTDNIQRDIKPLKLGRLAFLK